MNAPISNSLRSHAFKLLIFVLPFAASTEIGRSQEPTPQPTGDVQAYELVVNAQTALWDAYPSGYVEMHVEGEYEEDQVERADFKQWWRDHDLIRSEGTYRTRPLNGREAEERRFAILLTSQELLRAHAFDGDRIKTVTRLDRDSDRDHDWLWSTPRRRWFSTISGRMSLANLLRSERGVPDEVERDGMNVVLRYRDPKLLASDSIYDLTCRGALISAGEIGSPYETAEWTKDAKDRVIPESIRWSWPHRARSGSFEWNLTFVKVDLDAERPARDFTLEGMGLQRGARIVDMRSNAKTTSPQYFGGPPPRPDRLDALESATEAVPGTGFAKERP